MDNRPSIAVIGSEGYVGSAFCKMIEKYGKHNLVKYDPALKEKSATKEVVNSCNLGVVCVPTLMDKSVKFPHPCDTSIVESTIDWLETEVIMIKSTVEVGTTERLKAKTGKRIVMSPEYIGEGNYFIPDEHNFSKEMDRTPFWIVGGDEEDVKFVYNLLVPILGPMKRYIKKTASEAEMIKYWENTWLGFRVAMANEMKKTCEALGVNYYEVRDGWLADPRMSNFHTIAFYEKPGFAGKCLPKDLNALASACVKNGYYPELLIDMLKYNFKIREEEGLDNDYNPEA